MTLNVMFPSDRCPHFHGCRPLRVEGSTYLALWSASWPWKLVPSLNSSWVVGPLDVRELFAATRLPCVCITTAKSLTSFFQATRIPSQHESQNRRPPGNWGKANLSKRPSQGTVLALGESDHWVILWRKKVLRAIVHTKVASKEMGEYS